MTEGKNPIDNEICPTDYLSTVAATRSVLPYAVLVLDQPIMTPYFQHLWQNACYKICADGAANQLLQYNKEHHISLIPDMICGDNDSIRPETLIHFQTMKSQIRTENDQNFTDLQKCMKMIIEKFPSLSCIWIICELTGRFDHVMSIMQILHENAKFNAIALGKTNLTFLIPSSGKMDISFNRFLVGKHIGLIPFTGPTKVITHGLKWNLDSEILEFGKLISTSNTFESSHNTLVSILTEKPIIFTIDFPL